MDKKINGNVWKIAVAIVAFICIAYAYAPQVLTGKVVNQSDISSWQGMANEIVTHNQANPDNKTLWTNSMFSGMPATTISVIYDGDYTDPIYKLLFTGERPASYLLISLVGGFLLFLAFGVNVWLAFLGAIAISFCSYNMQIIQVGHNSKMVAIAFMPWVLAAIVYAYRKCAWWGGLLFAFALSFQIKANHPQITYYLAMILIGYGIWQLCVAVKEKTLPRFIRTSVILLAAGLIGISTNVNHLWPTYEYAQHTMRGGSELSPAGTDPADESGTEGTAGEKTRSGLDLEYATQWSYGIEETANLLIPNFNGGSSAGALGRDSETYKILKQSGYQGAEQVIKQLPLYWGPQPPTAGPMYMGAISIFLFVLGFFVLKGGIRWWIGGVSLLALMLGWGYHLMPVSEFFFNCVPMYNKFRTVSMILVILQILIPVMAVLTVNQLLFQENGGIPKQDLSKIKKGFYWALGLTAGFSLIFALIPSLAGSFVSGSDSQMPEDLIPALVEDRMSLLRADAFRTLAFILLGAGVLWVACIGKLKKQYAVIALIGLVLIDLWSVDKRYLNDSHFVTQKEFKNALNIRPVDNMILEDKDPNYRVLDLSVSTFNDAYVSYHHKTIGGYSAAKIQRYQDLIDRNISVEMNDIAKELRGVQTIEQAQAALTYHPVLSMLNTRYIVIDPNAPALTNPYALGNAWFVNEIIPVKNADQEIAKLKEIDPARQAVVIERFLNEQALLAEAKKTLDAAGNTQLDSTASITLTSYAPNKLIYKSNSIIPQTALFSEVYYHPGWMATIDGVEAPIFQANWILRGLQVPAGEHEIVFTFLPESFSKGELYSRLASGVLVLLLLGSLVVMFIKRKKDGK